MALIRGGKCRKFFWILFRRKH